MMTVEQFKAKGRYLEAGHAQAMAGEPCAYGCHYGMRSEREAALAEFRKGYAEGQAKRESKRAFLAHIAALYRVCNRADHDTQPEAEQWLPAGFAGQYGAGHLDALLRDMLDCGTLSADEHARFYDDM